MKENEMSEIRTTEITETIQTAIEGLYQDSQALTPYEIWKVWNVLVEALPELQGAKAKPSQMFYNYSTNGMIVKGAKAQMIDGVKHRYTQVQVAQFLTKMMVKALTS